MHLEKGFHFQMQDFLSIEVKKTLLQTSLQFERKKRLW